MGLFASEIRALQRFGQQQIYRGQQWVTSQLGFNPFQAYQMGSQFYSGVSQFIQDPGAGIMSLPGVSEGASLFTSIFGGGRDYPYLVDLAKQVKPGWSTEKILGMLRHYARTRDPKLHSLFNRAPYLLGPSIGLDEEATRGFLEWISKIGTGPKAKQFWGKLLAAARYKTPWGY